MSDIIKNNDSAFLMLLLGIIILVLVGLATREGMNACVQAGYDAGYNSAKGYPLSKKALVKNEIYENYGSTEYESATEIPQMIHVSALKDQHGNLRLYALNTIPKFKVFKFLGIKDDTIIIEEYPAPPKK